MDGYGDELDHIRRQLYAGPPEQFLQARATAEAATDDPALRAAVHALRKPTRAAWIVNSYAAAHPELVDELGALGRSLASAQAALDSVHLRELLVTRRRVVAAHTAAALSAAGATSAAVTDDVSATLDAAVADPGIAAELGTLQRARRWSGFGAVPATLTLLDTDTDETADDAPDDGSAAELALAETELAEAQEEEDEVRARLRRLSTRLATLQNDVAEARTALTEAQARTGRARRAHGTARSRAHRPR